NCWLQRRHSLLKDSVVTHPVDSNPWRTTVDNGEQRRHAFVISGSSLDRARHATERSGSWYSLTPCAGTHRIKGPDGRSHATQAVSTTTLRRWRPAACHQRRPALRKGCAGRGTTDTRHDHARLRLDLPLLRPPR